MRGRRFINLLSSTSPAFVTGLTRQNTARFAAGFAAMRAGTRNMNVFVSGDSTDRGTDETAVPYNSQYPLSVAEQLASLFRGSGVASGANNVYGISGTTFNDYMIRDSRCTATGATTAFQTAVPCQGGAEIEFPTAASTFSFTPQQPCDTADIYYQDSAAGRTFSWSVDGGAATQITTTGVNSILKATVPLGAVGAHTLTLAWVAAFVRVYGIDCYNSTRKEVTLRQWATSGGTTTTFNDNTGAPSSGRPRQIQLFPCDGGFGDLGLVNSWRGSRAIASCVTDVNTTIDTIRAAGGDFIFTTPPFDSGATGATAQQQQYIDAVHAAMLAKNVPIVNCREVLGSKANSDALGYTAPTDAVHWTTAGQAWRARALIMPVLQYAMGLS